MRDRGPDMSDEEPKLKVIPFTQKKKVDAPEPEYPPDKILDMAKGRYQVIMVLGWNNEEELSYTLSDGIDSGEAVLLLELVKNDILLSMLDE